jgi:hypothetical protein
MPPFDIVGLGAVGDVLAGHAPVAGELASTLPVGFDAVLQCGERLTHAVLAGQLAAASLTSAAFRAPWGEASLPPEAAAALAAHVSPLDTTTAFVQLALELRLDAPRLRTLGAFERPPVVAPDAARIGLPGEARPAEIVWTAEFNLLRIETEPVLALERRFGDVVAPVGDLVMSTGEDDGSGPSETVRRTRLGSGSVVTRAPLSMSARPELLQAWVEVDFGASTTESEGADPVLGALLAHETGGAWLSALQARISAAGRRRVTPRFALGGPLSAAQLGRALGPGRVDARVHPGTDGRELLTLGFNYGADVGGLIEEVKPFTGGRDFGLFVSGTVATAVIRSRWQAFASGRTLEGDTPVTLTLSDGSTGEGRARIRARFGGLRSVGMTARRTPPGDVIRVTYLQELQLLALWDPDGRPITDLGPLGEADETRSTLNVAPYAKAGPDEPAVRPEFKALLLQVLEPLARPTLDPQPMADMQGYVSATLGACVCRWSLPRPQPSRTAVADKIGGVLTR